jgi:peptidoglycan hydrolase CwlO-like protein
MKQIFFIIFSLYLGALFFVPAISHAQTLTSAQREALEEQLVQVQQEQAQAQIALTAAQAKSSSLANDIAVLNAKIKAEQLNIQAANLTVQTLGDTITTKQSEINTLDNQIQSDEVDMGSMFRQLYQADDTSPLEIFLSDQTISDFLTDSENIETIEGNLHNLSLQFEATVSSTTVEKAVLVTKQNSAVDARYALQQAQIALKSDQTQENQLLAISKGNEKSYTTLVAQKKAEAASINAQLFALAGGSNPIQFGQAYQYALTAAKATGIDPAFLLAILTQESNLGTNQGTCYLSKAQDGSGTSVKTGHVFSNVMSPTRDIPPFLQITETLGFDPFGTVVSCPQSIGWGGAMGPAQFIASTWMLFVSRIQKALGISDFANPWNPQHAFMASALYLSDLGATAGSYTAESNAACKYYSGSSCSKSSFVASYGTSVMGLANKIQTTEIDNLQ